VKSAKLILTGILSITVAHAGQAVQAEAWGEVLGQIGLLPAEDSPFAAAGKSYLENQIERKLTKQEAALVDRGDEGAWKTHTDELISFELPDDPLLNIEAFTPEEKPELRIVGGAVGTTDNSFSRVYRFSFSAGIPYGLLLVTKADWFDEGICFCGPIDLKTFVPTGGTLLELSQLPGGKVKKFQALNSTHRAVLFEWTHSAISQAAYARIGASLRFTTPSPRTTDEWVALTRKHRGAESGTGWLRPGMNRKSVESFMGRPDEEKDGTWLYIREERDEDGGGRRNTVRLSFENDTLLRLGADWNSFEELEPGRGSRAWFHKTIRAWSDDHDVFGEENKQPIAPDSDDISLMLAEFHRHAPGATGEDWEFWCGVIADLARQKVKDQKAVELIAKRSKESDLDHNQTRWVFELYDHPELHGFVHSRILFLLGENESARSHRHELHNLMASLDRNDLEAGKLIRKVLSHDDDEMRSTAAYFVDKLPLKDSRKQIKELLADKVDSVRWSATLNINELCTVEDRDWLAGLLAAETNEENRKLMEEKIGQLKSERE
jgi:hypothetical protein